MYFQTIIQKLSDYWASKGCALQMGYDLEMGAGTFNPATFFRSLGPEPYSVAYVEPSRRPTDGRYGDNPSRLQHYFQFQVILKPSPPDIQSLYLGSLEVLGLPLDQHDVRFIHDDWKSPTLGAWGMGWEVQVDGMEVSQFTYFQNMGGQPLKTITGELTYGLERLAMYLQGVDSVYDLKWNEHLTYGDIYHSSEVQWSTYNFEEASVGMWSAQFDAYEQEAAQLLEKKLCLPAYDFVMKASHAFNLLDARGAISVTERTRYINRIRELACAAAKVYLEQREALKFPLLKPQKKSTKKIKSPAAPKFNPEKTKDFVLEIGVEELPQTFISHGIRSLKEKLEGLFKNNHLSYESLETFSTPFRLTAYVKNLQEGSSSQVEQKKGPSVEKAFQKNGHPSPIGKGFLKSLKLKELTLQEIEEGKLKELSVFSIKNELYLKVTKKIPSKSAYEILVNQLPQLLLALDFPQKMIWGDLQVPFPRPLHSLLALFGKDLIPFEFANVQSHDHTFKKEGSSKKLFKVNSANQYLKIAAENHIVLSPKDRKDLILKQLEKLESKLSAKATFVPQVLNEVVHLCEDPHLMLGEFDSGFLSTPKELLELVMVTHQRYFPLTDVKGALIPYFVVCLNQKPNPKIKKGHQKALSPRLADGVFVYDQDLNQGLNQMKEKLRTMTFQNKLGSLEDKSKRLLNHAQVLNKYLQITSDSTLLEQSASLLKADLASHVVFEFPELQGIIGAHYAEKEKYPSFVSDAIKQHWLPRFDEDQLPSSESGLLFALADRMDNLIACFITHLIPSSSSDPYALRRQTLGIIRILIENKIHIPLKEVLEQCFSHFPIKGSEQIYLALHQFISSRIKTVFKRYHLKADEIESVLDNEELDVYDLFLRVQALHEFKKTKECTPLMEVYKRAKGQLNAPVKVGVDMELFEKPIEGNLYRFLLNLKEEFLQTIEDHEYSASFSLLASLHPYLENLFNSVQILDPNEKIRLNRLALLQEVIELFITLVDFSAIQIL